MSELLQLVLLLLFQVNLSSATGVTCSSTPECTANLRIGSICNNGFCTNPLINGCLHHQYNHGSFASTEKENSKRGIQKFVEGKKRVCNSDDPPDAVERNICQKVNPYFNYTEIRIASGNWDSALFFGWIMQILLSEVFMVPATIDNGMNESSSFYDENNGLSYTETPYPWDGLVKANNLTGDCSQVNSTEFCCHILPEVWPSVPQEYENEVESGFSGMIGASGWYVPTFTLNEYPMFGSYTGLHNAGEKLAEIFKRPTTWKDYCEQVSIHNCSIDDDVATRWPINEDEELSYFVDEEYTGHFRYMEKNNCSNPEIKCTGHFIDYPCGWTSYFESQAYWNGIDLENDVKYTTNSIRQILSASDATKSHVIFTWWYPEPTIAEGYQRVALPKVTSQCFRERAKTFNSDYRCDDTDRTIELRSQKVTSCDHPYTSISKVYAQSLIELSLNFTKATKNPAYDLLSDIRITSADVMDMLEDLGEDSNHYDARDAVCSWVIRNFDRGTSNLTKFFPSNYPMELSNEDVRSISIVSIVIGSLSICGVLVTIFLIYYWREREVIQYAQIEFLCALCAGYMVGSVAAVLYGLVPSPETCMAREWFDLLGYTMVIIPILVKISIINAIKRHNRRGSSATETLKINASEKLLRIMNGVLLSICIIYLICWTVIDPSKRQENAILTEESKVLVQISCASSKYSFWKIFTNIWMGVCVIYAFILKVQSKSSKSIFNELTHVSILIDANFLFFVFRSILVHIPSIFSFNPRVNDSIMSIILSLEVMVNLGCYFGPKFWMMYTRMDMIELSGSTVLSVSTRGSIRLSLNSTETIPTGRKTLVCANCEKEIVRRESMIRESVLDYNFSPIDESCVYQFDD